MLHVILSGSTACPDFLGAGRRCALQSELFLLRAVTLLSGLAAAQGPGSALHGVVAGAGCKSRRGLQGAIDEAESGPATERMARIVADDEYGVALLAIAHQPKQSLDAFDRGIALLPASTVKPDSLQWAVAFWHRATAYQQLDQWEQAAGRSGTAEDTLTKAHRCCRGNAALAQHLTQLRQRVRAAARRCAGAPGQAQRSAKPASYTIVLLTGGYVSATPGCSSGIINL